MLESLCGLVGRLVDEVEQGERGGKGGEGRVQSWDLVESGHSGMIVGHRRSVQNFSVLAQRRSLSRPHPRASVQIPRLPQLSRMAGISHSLAQSNSQLSRLGRGSRRKLTTKQLKTRVENLIESCSRSLSRSPSVQRQPSPSSPLPSYRPTRKLLHYEDIKRILKEDEKKTLRLNISSAYGK